MIPDKAYGAAGEAVAHYSAPVDTPQLSQVITEAIQAAAPFIRAEALREEAPRLRRVDGHDWYVHDRYTREALLARADELDPQ